MKIEPVFCSECNEVSPCDPGEIWIEFQAPVFSYVYSLVKDHNTAYDLHQEVFLKLHGFCSHRRGIRQMRSWLFRLAHNVVMDHFRRQKRQVKPENIPASEPDKILHKAESLVRPILDFLPPAYAEPLRLSDIEGYKLTQIAQMLNLSLTATKSRVQRARRLLREKFYRCCDIETDSLGNLTAISVKKSCTPLHKALSAS